MDGPTIINRMLFIAAFSRRISVSAVAMGIAVLLCIRPAGAVELKVLSGFAMRAPLQELAREFEATSGHTLVIESAFVGKVAEKVAADDPVDVVIISKPVFDKLVDTEKLAGGSGRPLACGFRGKSATDSEMKSATDSDLI